MNVTTLPDIWAACVVCALAVAPVPAYTQTVVPCEPAVMTLAEAAELLRIDVDAMERLAEQEEAPGRRIEEVWRFNCATLMAWLNGNGKVKAASVPLSARDLDSVSATGTPVVQDEETTEASPTDNGQDVPIGEAPEERRAEDVFLRGQRVLLGPGEVVIELGQFYSRIDDRQLVSVGAGIGLATLQQEALTTLLQGRVGVLNETELFGSASFLNLNSHQFLGSTTLATSGRTGFGAARVGARRTLLREGAGRPDIIATVSGLVPNSNAGYGIGGGMVLVKSIDPVVLFASGNYLRTFRRDLSGGTRLGPSDSVDVSVGYGLALNDTIAISMGASGLFAGTAIVDDATFRRPDSFSGSFGLTAWLAEGLYIEPSVSFGLSGPGQSFAFGVTMPYSF